MRRIMYAMIAAGLVVLATPSPPGVAATFQVEEEEDGPLCWLDFALSGGLTLALFSGKGRGGKTVEILLEDRQDSGRLAKVPETFEITFQFGDGGHQSYQGSISEYYGEPYAEARAALVKKLSDGGAFKLVVSGLGAVDVKDTLSSKTYSQFVNCLSR